jgi:hypothetical protein
MSFLCETDRAGHFDEDVGVFVNTIRHSRQLNPYIAVIESDITSKYKNRIPVGSISFVETFLKLHDIPEMYPVEVPEVLRTADFLGRDYVICPYDKLPKRGYWFIKDVSHLKRFNGVLYIDDFEDNYEVTDQMRKDMWVYSSVLRFGAEYRFYICDDDIITYALYDLADRKYLNKFPDIAKIEEMILKYARVPSPEAYTMDVGVTITGETYLLEIHPFTSVGLYTTLLGDMLPIMYEKGFSWYLSEHNKPLKEWEFLING